MDTAKSTSSTSDPTTKLEEEVRALVRENGGPKRESPRPRLATTSWLLE